SGISGPVTTWPGVKFCRGRRGPATSVAQRLSAAAREKIAVPNRRLLIAEVGARDLNVAVLSQLAATQLPLHDKFEPGSLEVERLHAPLGRWRLIEEALEDPPGDPH